MGEAPTARGRRGGEAPRAGGGGVDASRCQWVNAGRMSEPPPLMPLAPVPVLPMDYSSGQARPGIISAVGILSIVIASLGLLGGVVSGLYAVGFTVASAVTSKAASSIATSNSQYTATANVSVVGPN